MKWNLFASIFSLIFIAELPDKTIFATLIMATTGNPFAIFIGVCAAFTFQSVIAVLFGRLISQFPHQWVGLATGLLFLGFALYTWIELKKQSDDSDEHETLKKGNFLLNIWNSFLIIFIAEWGDLTQILTASMTAKYPQDLTTVFFASTAALWTATGLTVFVGQKLKNFINPRLLKKISVGLFILIGLYFIYESRSTV